MNGIHEATSQLSNNFYFNLTDYLNRIKSEKHMHEQYKILDAIKGIFVAKGYKVEVEVSPSHNATMFITW